VSNVAILIDYLMWNKDVLDKRFKRDACLIVDIEALEKRISVSFPKKYIEMMLVQNGGYVMCDEFVYCKRSYERKGMIPNPIPK
jgi:hypothetical protein